jgi:hypothetical protein
MLKYLEPGLKIKSAELDVFSSLDINSQRIVPSGIRFTLALTQLALL